MMVQIKELLNLRIPLILASQSPRRKKLLSQLGFDFQIIPSEVDESKFSHSSVPADYVVQLSLQKALDVANRQKENSIVVGADTIVVLDGKIMEKPTDKDDAFRMLKSLSGRTHTVYTGIALIETPSLKSVTAFQQTEVTFRELEDDEINAYIATGSPMDKAGAYGIQDDFGAVFISEIHGCYYNIVGLPLELLYSTLKNFIRG